MRKTMCVAVVLAALAYAAPARAGCWVTATLVPIGGASPGTWTAEFTIHQRGRNPLPSTPHPRPRVAISNAAGDHDYFAARPVDPAKRAYEGQIVFPSEGMWTVSVFDDVRSWNKRSAPCSRWHRLGTVQIGPAAPRTVLPGTADSFSVGVSAALLIVGGVSFRLRARLSAVA
jgi:hypothetical protein